MPHISVNEVSLEWCRRGVQVKSILMFCWAFSVPNITLTKWGVVQLQIKWHNRFTISSVTPSLGRPSAAFEANDAAWALLCPGHLRQKEALRHPQWPCWITVKGGDWIRWPLTLIVLEYRRRCVPRGSLKSRRQGDWCHMGAGALDHAFQADMPLSMTVALLQSFQWTRGGGHWKSILL